MDTQTHQAPGETKENKYLLLLIALLVVVTLIPIHHELTIADMSVGEPHLLTVLFVAVMVFGVRAVSGHRLLRPIGTGLWIAALVVYTIRIAALEKGGYATRVAETITTVMLLAGLVMLTLMILADLFREAGVTRDRLRGAACAYLLMGLAWALAYTALDGLIPDSFMVGENLKTMGTAVPGPKTPSPVELGSLVYYSFVTLTTLGYGDITPERPLAATVAWLEALAGQFYLTVLVAILVGKRLATWMAESRS